MDRKRLRILLSAVVILLAVVLGMEFAAARQESPVDTTPPAPSTTATTAPVEATEAPVVTLPPNMLPIG